MLFGDVVEDSKQVCLIVGSEIFSRKKAKIRNPLFPTYCNRQVFNVPFLFKGGLNGSDVMPVIKNPNLKITAVDYFRFFETCDF